MPSSVIRRSRRHGLMMNHQMANGRPTQSTIAFAMRRDLHVHRRIARPGGHPLEVGPGDPPDPHVQLENQDGAADGRPDLDGLDLRLNLGAKCGRAAERLGDAGAFLVRQIVLTTALPPSTSHRPSSTQTFPPGSQYPRIYQLVSGKPRGFSDSVAQSSVWSSVGRGSDASSTRARFSGCRGGGVRRKRLHASDSRRHRTCGGLHEGRHLQALRHEGRPLLGSERPVLASLFRQFRRGDVDGEARSGRANSTRSPSGGAN